MQRDLTTGSITKHLLTTMSFMLVTMVRPFAPWGTSRRARWWGQPRFDLWKKMLAIGLPAGFEFAIFVASSMFQAMGTRCRR